MKYHLESPGLLW